MLACWGSLMYSLRETIDHGGWGIRPEILLIADLTSVIVRATSWEMADETVKDETVLKELEATARRAKYMFAASHRHNKYIRQLTTDKGRRIAAVIRKHEEKVVEVPESQRWVVSASLLNGLVCVLQGNWDRFLVIEPEPAVKSVVRRFLPRIALAGALVVCAVLLPSLMGDLIKDPVAFRATILITAVFTLITPDVQKAADALRSFRGK